MAWMCIMVPFREAEFQHMAELTPKLIRRVSAPLWKQGLVTTCLWAGLFTGLRVIAAVAGLRLCGRFLISFLGGRPGRVHVYRGFPVLASSFPLACYS